MIYIYVPIWANIDEAFTFIRRPLVNETRVNASHPTQIFFFNNVFFLIFFMNLNTYYFISNENSSAANLIKTTNWHLGIVIVWNWCSQMHDHAHRILQWNWKHKYTICTTYYYSITCITWCHAMNYFCTFVDFILYNLNKYNKK